jgi:hypothetical protein
MKLSAFREETYEYKLEPISANDGPKRKMVLDPFVHPTRAIYQCCGTVTIFYGSGSDF